MKGFMRGIARAHAIGRGADTDPVDDDEFAGVLFMAYMGVAVLVLVVIAFVFLTWKRLG